MTKKEKYQDEFKQLPEQWQRIFRAVGLDPKSKQKRGEI